MLQIAGIGTLLFDLLTRAEEEVDAYTCKHRFDIGLLAERLAYATQWIDGERGLRDARIGYFGASTGSAAALVAAAKLKDRVSAVVSTPDDPKAEVRLAIRALHERIVFWDKRSTTQTAATE